MSVEASYGLRLLAVLTALSAGCAEPDVHELAQDAQEAPEVLAQASDVVASGTGCPAGTWSASGNALSGNLKLTFNAYKASISPPANTRECNLSMTVRPSGRTKSAVKSFTLVGSGDLSTGVSARIGTRAWAQGSPGSTSQTEPFTAPFRGAFSRTKTIAEEDLAWSVCGLDRRHNLSSFINLQNISGGAAGWLNVTSIANIKVIYRPC